MAERPFGGRALHLIGIGGAGMSGLALVAQALGARVTGSDRATSGPYVERLRAAGIDPSTRGEQLSVTDFARLAATEADAP